MSLSTGQYHGTSLERNPDIESYQRTAAIVFLAIGNLNFQSISGIILSHSAVYRFEKQRTDVMKAHTTGIKCSKVCKRKFGDAFCDNCFGICCDVLFVDIDGQPRLNEVTVLSYIDKERNFTCERSLIDVDGFFNNLLRHSKSIDRLAPVLDHPGVIRSNTVDAPKEGSL